MIFSFIHLTILFICSAFSCDASLSSDTVYLTWQNDPTSTMTVQWIASDNPSPTQALYAVKSNLQEWNHAESQSYKIPGSSNYFLHRIELKNLDANTEYLFKIHLEENLQEAAAYQFKTAPKDLKNGLRFVEGGDMYHDGKEFMIKTCLEAAKTNPLFAVLGGDIAYAVGRPSHIEKIERWIDWVKIWHSTMISPQGNLIPVIAAIGNHDLIGQFNQTPRQAAVFSLLFPMPGTSIYNVLDFNKYLSIILLDSGHANPIKGAQTEWLKATLDARQNVTYLMAAYHVPAYSSVRSFLNPLSVAIRSFWVPLFEQGGVRAVFEHHDHAYKRTFPLLGNKINPKGVVYLGDGAWGVKYTRISPRAKKRFYIAKFSSARNFILVTMNLSEIKFEAINDKGEVFDSCVL